MLPEQHWNMPVSIFAPNAKYLHRRGDQSSMWDIGCIAASIGFFAIAVAYVTACERLGSEEKS